MFAKTQDNSQWTKIGSNFEKLSLVKKDAQTLHVKAKLIKMLKHQSKADKLTHWAITFLKSTQ